MTEELDQVPTRGDIDVLINNHLTRISKAQTLSGEVALKYCVTEGLLSWYVVTNNTSWCDVEKAIHSGPYASREEAESKCLDTSMWCELLSKEEAEAITY